MRDDALLILIAGAGGFMGNGAFAPSPLNAVQGAFAIRYPDVPIMTLDWNSPRPICPFIANKKVLIRGHSFGGQRALHQIAGSDANADELVVQLDDPVRYSRSNTVDLGNTISSDPFIQKFDREDLAVPMEVEEVWCFLRHGGQGLFSYPMSSPVQVADASRVNVVVDVPGIFDLAKHADICKQPVVMQKFWDLATALFGAS